MSFDDFQSRMELFCVDGCNPNTLTCCFQALWSLSMAIFIDHPIDDTTAEAAFQFASVFIFFP